MQNLYFISGNLGKIREVQEFIPHVQSWPLDLPEIQELDAQKVIEAKLLAALELAGQEKQFFVEDTSLALHVLKGLPGPLIKWFIAENSLGLSGLADLALKLGDCRATAFTVIGYLKRQGQTVEMAFFKGEVAGQIVTPRGENGFGWDAIFQPEGSEKSFAEMSLAEKQSYSMRRIALAKFQAFLQAQNLNSPPPLAPSSSSHPQA